LGGASRRLRRLAALRAAMARLWRLSRSSERSLQIPRSSSSLLLFFSSSLLLFFSSSLLLFFSSSLLLFFSPSLLLFFSSSLLLFIAVVTGEDENQAAEDLRRLAARHPDIKANCFNVKFRDSRGRRGQKDTSKFGGLQKVTRKLVENMSTCSISVLLWLRCLF
jgi:hypothetical protein